ncbi:DUF6891 domain-containing protein [Hydrogenophaga sp.]|uniref:DUF6891 domain-containing protein n=1 Tax=Hydrogenophaga sp. TaxID=1904254 RepID=UPI003D0A2DC7
MTDSAPPSPFQALSLDFPPAERMGAQVEYYHSPHQRLYGLNVHFVGAEPAHETMDRVLRECATLAAAHKSDFNIVVDAYLLAHADSELDERKTLSPYGRDFFLCFDAHRRQIGVRRNGRKQFEDAWPVTDVDVAGAGEAAEEPVYPLDDDAGMDDEVDDATDTMRAMVKEWIWYGYDAPEDIDRWIDENAAAGDDFDVVWVKAFATALLAKKRAAEATWPKETDCDRLDRAFDSLNAQGICALQCAGNTMSDGFESVSDVINADDVPEGRYTGFCFFHSQDLDRALYGEGLMLAFGYLDSQDAADFIAVGRKVCEVLQQHGLQTEWDGSDNSRINLPAVRWQRRTPH